MLIGRCDLLKRFIDESSFRFSCLMANAFFYYFHITMLDGLCRCAIFCQTMQNRPTSKPYALLQQYEVVISVKIHSVYTSTLCILSLRFLVPFFEPFEPFFEALELFFDPLPNASNNSMSKRSIISMDIDMDIDMEGSGGVGVETGGSVGATGDAVGTSAAVQKPLGGEANPSCENKSRSR